MVCKMQECIAFLEDNFAREIERISHLEEEKERLKISAYYIALHYYLQDNQLKAKLLLIQKKISRYRKKIK